MNRSIVTWCVSAFIFCMSHTCIKAEEGHSGNRVLIGLSRGVVWRPADFSRLESFYRSQGALNMQLKDERATNWSGVFTFYEYDKDSLKRSEFEGMPAKIARLEIGVNLYNAAWESDGNNINPHMANILILGDKFYWGHSRVNPFVGGGLGLHYSSLNANGTSFVEEGAIIDVHGGCELQILKKYLVTRISAGYSGVLTSSYESRSYAGKLNIPGGEIEYYTVDGSIPDSAPRVSGFYYSISFSVAFFNVAE